MIAPFFMVLVAAVLAASPVIVLMVAMFYGKAIVGLIRALLHWIPRRRRMAIDMQGLVLCDRDIRCDETLVNLRGRGGA